MILTPAPHPSWLTRIPGRLASGWVPEGSSPAQFTFQAPLSSGLPPCPIPAQCFRGCCLQPEAAPCEMAAVGGGRAQPEKTSIYKAPSSLLHPGGWGLGAGSHSSMGNPMGCPHWAKQDHRAQTSPRPGSAGPGEVRCRSPTVAGNQIKFFPDVRDSTVAIPTLGRIPRLPDGLGLSQGVRGPGIPTRAGVTHRAGNTEQQILNRPLCFLVNMATWASKRRSGAGLLQRTNNTARTDKHRTCSQSTATGCLGSRLVLHLIDRRYGGSQRRDLLKVTCCMSIIPTTLPPIVSLSLVSSDTHSDTDPSQPSSERGIANPIFQIEKLRPREVKSLPQSHKREHPRLQLTLGLHHYIQLPQFLALPPSE